METERTVQETALPSAEGHEIGINGDSLDKLDGELRRRKIEAVVVARFGKIGWEWHESGKDTIGPLFSCTKSVLSALFGKALQEGLVANTRQPLTDYLRHTKLRDEHKRITLEHLLTMTPGFEWPDFDKLYREMRAADDPVGFVLERPIMHRPGQTFAYNSGSSLLLSAILTQVTGQTALDYARDKLFLPLRFRGAKWTEHGGINEGGTGMQLYAGDLAKLGQLFLQKGMWNGQQLLPSDWVQRSTETHHRALLHYKPPIYGSYGYHWWISPAEHNGAFDCYFAYGFGGQYLLVAPKEELVVVIRKKPEGRKKAVLSRELMFKFIASAVR